MNRGRRLPLYRESSTSEGINLSSLIDIIFILLIFFIVTTVFIEETGVEIQKPSATAANALQKEAIYIAITDRGEVIYADQNIGINGVRSIVQRLLKKESLPVIIQADKTAPIDLYTKVHNQALLAGATVINLATNL
jgi:biopolymer transport protein ExbD